jgi:hypothetical protein
MSFVEHVQVGAENLVQRVQLAGRSVRRLGKARWFWRLSYALWLDGLRGPAHRASRQLPLPAQWSSEDVTYGETPVVTAYTLLQASDFPAGGNLVELGCGRGVLSLVAHLAFGAQAVGLDVVPRLIDRARWLATALGTDGVEFRCADAGTEPLPQADLYYLTPTTWSAPNLGAVKARLAEVRPGSRAVSLTEPLGGDWEVYRRETLLYSWGPSPTYFQRKTVLML